MGILFVYLHGKLYSVGKKNIHCQETLYIIICFGRGYKTCLYSHAVQLPQGSKPR